jgi:hypothetical protein
MKSLGGDDALVTTLTSLHLMNLGSTCTQLTSTMDSMTLLVIVSTLMKEDNGWSTMIINKANSGHQRKIIMAVSLIH